MRKLILGTVLFGVMNSTPVLAAGSDELWEVTSQTDMPGMPMKIPPSSIRMCVPKGQVNNPERTMPNKNQESKCKMIDLKSSANKTSWKMRCEGEAAMSGSGEMTYGPDSYHSVVRTVTNYGGKTMNMTQVMDGKRIGTCQAKSK